MKHILHIHQQKIRKGLPAIIDRTYKGSSQHHTRVGIVCPNCACEAAVIVQSDVPDRCGAHVWIEARETTHG